MERQSYGSLMGCQGVEEEQWDHLVGVKGPLGRSMDPRSGVWGFEGPKHLAWSIWGRETRASSRVPGHHQNLPLPGLRAARGCASHGGVLREWKDME